MRKTKPRVGHNLGRYSPLTVVLLFLCAVLITAKPQVATKDSVVIFNSSSNSIAFGLRDEKTHEWKEYSLGASADLLIKNVTDIRVETIGSRVVQYQLVKGNRYKIYWNSSKGCWDIVTVVARGPLNLNRY